MKKNHIWLFIISLLAPVYWTTAQELVEEIEEVGVDTLKKREKKPYTIRFGLDLSKPVMAQLDKDFCGLELVGDIRLFSEFYGAIELGNEKKTQQSEQINFTTTGSYLKLGFDYNLYENWKGMNNAIYLGMRIGNSFFKQKVNEYEPYQINHYWTTEIIKNGPEIREQDALSARWVEFIAGIKVKMINNLYMGFSIRLNRLINDTRPDNFDNLYIPGFNKKTDENVWGAGFNYTLTYSIPVKL
ncbi:MAG: hypothetical protein GWP29_06095 [Bacteroidetes bacterium]|nr:hypothetical protein [Bacteroidota bacterium]